MVVHAGHPIEGTVESAIRRLSATRDRLAIPTVPEPGEGLADLFFRAASNNGFRNVDALWRIMSGELKSKMSHHALVNTQVTEGIVSDFVGTHGGTNSIVDMLYAQERPGVVAFFGAVIRRDQLSRNRRVSPRFLAAQGYMKAVWALECICFDPTNRELLLENCPVCNVKLAYNFSMGVAHCHKCISNDGRSKPLVDLRDYPQSFVELESFENLDFFVSLIDPQSPSKRDLAASLHQDLRRFDRGQVFELVSTMAQILDAQQRQKGDGHKVTPKSLSDAMKAIRAWPKGLIEFGEMTRHAWRHESYKSGRGYPHPLPAEMRSNRAYFDRNLRTLVTNHIRASHNPLLDEAPKSRFQRKRPQTFQAGGFDTMRKEDQFVFLSVLASKSKAVAHDVKSFGLPRTELVRLYAQGVLACPEPAVDAYLSPASALASSMTVHRAAGGSPCFGVTVYDACLVHDVEGRAWSAIAKYMLEEMSSFDGGVLGSFQRDIHVHELDAIQQIAANSTPDRQLDEVVLTTKEAGFYLGQHASEVARLVTSGMLPERGIRLRDVKAFRRRFVSGREIFAFHLLNGGRTNSKAVTFTELSQAGLNAIHSKPSIRDRAAVGEYFGFDTWRKYD